MVLSGQPRTVHAGEERVGALPVEVEGELGEELRRRLDEALIEGLQRGAFEVVAASGDCGDAACWVGVADSAEVGYLVRATIAAEARTYAVDVSVIDGRDGSVVAASSEVCEVCGALAVRELVADQAAGLRKKLDDLVAGAPRVVVRSAPQGAVVQIDRETVGRAPVKRELAEGKHVARAELDGYVAVEREFLAVPGVEETITLQLEPLPDIRPKLRPWGWVLIGGGIASVTAGVTFLALHRRPAPGDRCDGDNLDAQGNCRFRFDTVVPGAVLTAAGGIIIIGGAFVAALTGPRRGARRAKRSARRFPVGRGRMVWAPAGLGVRARF